MNTQGIGLGLVICENIVKAFDGSIGLSSFVDIGTQFTFSIPLSFKLDKVNANDNIKGGDSLALMYKPKAKVFYDESNSLTHKNSNYSNL